MSDHLLVDVTDGVGRLTLNAPERLNAVTAAMLDDLEAELARLVARADVRAIALTGAGRGFCSGADLSASGADGDIDPATLYAIGRVVRAIAGCPKPLLTVVNGIAAGAGCSLAVAGPYVIAAESASFMLAFSRLGLIPDGGATGLITAAVGRARALRLALTAERLPAATAVQWGLIAESCPDDALAGRAEELLRAFAAAPPLAWAQTVAVVNAASLDLDAVLAREETVQQRLLQSADFREGVAAFAGRRAPTFRGA
jgi:enoyl-CoA hydratase